MALRLHDLIPIDDVGDGAGSLIEELFGDEFYIEDEAGQALTTARNQRLLGYAKAIRDGFHPRDTSLRLPDIGCLRELADKVTLSEYRRARDRDAAAAWRHHEWDHTEAAGSLE